jgi:hypothetical protein
MVTNDDDGSIMMILTVDFGISSMRRYYFGIITWVY